MLRLKELFATKRTVNQEGAGTCRGQHKGVAATTRHAHTKYSRHVSDVHNNFGKNFLREFAATIMYMQPGIFLACMFQVHNDFAENDFSSVAKFPTGMILSGPASL